MRTRNKRIRNKRTRHGRKASYIAASALSAAAVLAGICLPGAMLGKNVAAAVDRVEEAPAKYYNAAGFAMAQNASAKLDAYDRLRLVSGSWDSTPGEATVYEMELRAHEAVDAARRETDRLYESGLYPSRLSPSYGNWYSWEALPCKAVDGVFNTYTAYYWKISFRRYDGGESHTVYILEDGTVIAAKAYIPDGFEEPVNVHTVISTEHRLPEEAYERQDTQGLEPKEWAALPELDLSGMNWKDMTLITADEPKSVYAMQLISDDGYVFMIKAQ